MKRRWIAAGLGLLLLGSGAGRAQPPETFGTPGPAASTKARKAPRPLPSEEMGVKLKTVPEVRLPALDREKLLREDAATKGPGKALRYGIGRDVRISARDGDWYELAGGRGLWLGEIAASGALGVRLHLTGKLPAGSELRRLRSGRQGEARDPRELPRGAERILDRLGLRRAGADRVPGAGGLGLARAAVHRGPPAAPLPRSRGGSRRSQ